MIRKGINKLLVSTFERLYFGTILLDVHRDMKASCRERGAAALYDDAGGPMRTQNASATRRKWLRARSRPSNILPAVSVAGAWASLPGSCREPCHTDMHAHAQSAATATIRTGAGRSQRGENEHTNRSSHVTSNGCIATLYSYCRFY